MHRVKQHSSQARLANASHTHDGYKATGVIYHPVPQRRQFLVTSIELIYVWGFSPVEMLAPLAC
jgi:hypothetical protein